MRKDHAFGKRLGVDLTPSEKLQLVEDLWDDGWTVMEREPPEEPIKLPYVMTAIIGLLCVEWLTRKLLRLA